MVSEEKIFKFFPITSLWEIMTPGRGQLGPRGLIGRIYVGDHSTLHTKYISPGPHGFREEDFFKFLSIISLWENDTRAWPVWTPGA